MADASKDITIRSRRVAAAEQHAERRAGARVEWWSALAMHVRALLVAFFATVSLCTAAPRLAASPLDAASDARTALAQSASPSSSSLITVPGEDAADVSTEARVVARLDVTIGEVPRQLVRATLPIPKGVWPRADGRSPFALRAPLGAPVVAQVETVARSATGEADVVELIAPLVFDAQVKPGARTIVSVLYREQGFDAAQSAPEVPASVRALVGGAAPGRIWLRARDVHGNVYAAELCGIEEGLGFGARTTRKSGAWLRQERTHVTLMPVAPAKSAQIEPLPHAMSAHAYLTTSDQDESLVLDLRVHNGAIAGSRLKAPGEEVLGLLYFESLELLAPSSWSLVPEIVDPSFGAPYQDGARTVWPIVAKQKGGRLHLMGPQAQFERRFVLVPAGNEARARARLGHLGLGFPLFGDDLWSWKNPRTAHYFPQRDPLASVDFVKSGELSGKSAVRRLEELALDRIERSLRTGTPQGEYVIAPAMGWAHPWFIKEQGGVGGEGIATIEGHYAAAAASPAGVRRLSLLHRMNVSRQPEAQYDARGEIVGYHAWLDSKGRIPFDYRTHGRVVIPSFALPMNGGPPASAQVLEVVRQNRRPPYDQGNPYERGGAVPRDDGALLAWWPHDDQHLVRYTKNTKALAWLANDSMAKDDLRLSAELFRLFVHESEHARVDWSIGLTLAVWRKIVDQFPNQGLPLGREHAWGIDAMCAAYSLADDEWRARQRPWFDAMSRLMLDASLPNGLIQRTVNERLLGDKRYTAAQTFECLFLVHAMRCMTESVYRGVDDARRAEIEALQLRAIEFLFFGPPWARVAASWQPDPAHPTLYFQGPRQAIAISLNDERATPPFSDERRWGGNYLPADGLGGGVEIFHPWAALAYASEIRPDELGVGLKNRYLRRVLDCAAPQTSWRALMTELAAQTGNPSTDNSANWIGLMARLQNLGAR